MAANLIQPSPDARRRLLPDEPLPPYSYVTGQFPHPTREPDGHSFGQAPEPCSPPDLTRWDECRPYLRGLDLFNYGYYWEAHEVWEGIWHACNRTGVTAAFIQGLIKLAAAGVKSREGRPQGVQRHARRAAELFDQAARGLSAGQTEYLGLSLPRLTQLATNVSRELAVASQPAGTPVEIVFPFVLYPENFPERHPMSSLPRKITAEESGAFVELCTVEPTAPGPLDGLTFAVKDLIDVAGTITGCGNPHWRATHGPAAGHAVSVEQLLAAGARCIGKTVTDEFAFSLLGESHFYGTPLNPRAPECIPGGSSSGSASAVACELVDFALGTDTAGSVRVPASNCGLYGFRPSHGIISAAGVMPFAPSFDTVGVLARDANVLARAASVLLGQEIPARPQVGTLHVIPEAFAVCDANVVQTLQTPLKLVSKVFGVELTETSIHVIDGEPAGTDMTGWYQAAFRGMQWLEVWNSLGAWVSAAQEELGPTAANNFELTRNLPRNAVNQTVQRRERYFQTLLTFLKPLDLICIPTSPTPAPLKKTVGQRDKDTTNYFPRILPLTSLAGVGRLPQVSLPLADCEGRPVGLSLLAKFGQDAFLLGAVQMLAAEATRQGKY